MHFEAFAEDITKNGWNVFGAEVYQKGVLTHRFGDTDEDIHEIYSGTKSILAIAFGIVYDEGLIELDRCILDYLPKENVEKMSEKQRLTFESITVRRLLTMSVLDLPFRAEGDNWLDFSLACEIKDPKQKSFNYSNISSYLIGVALTVVLGRDLGGFIEERIFAPLGIDRYEFMHSPEGYFYGASGTKLTVHAFSQLGLLLYNRGVANGQRILSEEFVDMATGIQQMNREGGYGFFIWKYRDGFSINGKWKQKCYILPERGLVISYLSHIEDDSHELLESMDKHLLGIEK